MRFTTDITKRQFYIFIALLLCLMGAFLWSVGRQEELPPDEESYVVQEESITVPENTSMPESTIEEEPISVVIEETEETFPYMEDDYIYPYNTMSADWGIEVYESGFNYYEIPQQYIDWGGCFPEVVQVYLWELCRQNEIDYYIVVALIEKESKYKWNATGDSGNSKGYMQIYEKWHRDRMDDLGITDLYNPYHNISTGISFLSEIYQKYDDYNRILMVYNMGYNGARRNWEKGVYSTEYSREIVQRAQEIKQELQD